MNTIDELIYYCNEKDPVGAIMLTGEWGCGKTYLIEHALQEELKDTHILVRVSLFGISSIEELNAIVKKKWIEKCNKPLSKLGDDNNYIKGIKRLIGIGGTVGGHFLSGIDKTIDAVLSINLRDFIPIKPSITDDNVEKKVVLIFDDLERSKLDTVDILGCINDYCENQKFSTIIIANEEKITKPETNENTALSYNEIKEKIVSRTVTYKPDYSSIVDSIIDNQQWDSDQKDNDSYKSFLQENKPNILELLETKSSVADNNSTEGETYSKTTSHNIRSLKCALQDFHRVYKKLSDYEIPISNKKEFLYSYVAYVLADRAGLVKKREVEPGYYSENLRQIYPFFSERSFPSCIRRWIKYSDWNEAEINKELEEYKWNIAVVKPKDILRVNRILDVEDSDVEAGFKELLDDYCYKGDLTLDEYVNFIENACLIRKYSITIPIEIEWDKIYDGIKKVEKEYVENNRESDSLYGNRISWGYKDLLSEEEQEAYALIDNFRKDNVLLFKNNRKKYLDDLGDEKVNALRTCRQLKFRSFDEEMALKTAERFEKSSQEEKAVFPSAFSKMWEDKKFVDLETTQRGFSRMRGEIESLSEKYESEGKTISIVHAKSLISVLKELEEKVKKKIELLAEKAKEKESKEDLFIDISTLI